MNRIIVAALALTIPCTLPAHARPIAPTSYPAYVDSNCAENSDCLRDALSAGLDIDPKKFCWLNADNSFTPLGALGSADYFIRYGEELYIASPMAEHASMVYPCASPQEPEPAAATTLASPVHLPSHSDDALDHLGGEPVPYCFGQQGTWGAPCFGVGPSGHYDIDPDTLTLEDGTQSFAPLVFPNPKDDDDRSWFVGPPTPAPIAEAIARRTEAATRRANLRLQWESLNKRCLDYAALTKHQQALRPCETRDKISKSLSEDEL